MSQGARQVRDQTAQKFNLLFMDNELRPTSATCSNPSGSMVTVEKESYIVKIINRFKIRQVLN